MKIRKKLLAILMALTMTMGVVTVDQAINQSHSDIVNAAQRHKHRKTTTHKKRRRRVRHHFDRTKIYTSTGKTIIGNRKSHIYHVYSQHSYRMNRGNAVYFKSEKAARAAGYRKSLR